MSDPQPSSTSQQPANGSQEQQSSIPPSSAQPQSSLDTTDSTIKPEPDLDASIEQDIDMNAEQTGAGAEESAAAAFTTEVDQLAESSQPSKKETSLREFLGKMDEYAPIVSESLRLSLSLFFYTSRLAVCAIYNSTALGLGGI
jgi:transcription initiation factor TFIID subunit 10